MKKVLSKVSCLLLAFALSVTLSLALGETHGAGVEIDPLIGNCLIPDTAITFYVSVDGNDDFDGSLNKPFRTIDKAREAVSQVNSDMKQDIVVYLRGGVYQMDEAIKFSPADSGNNGYYIYYAAYPGEKPIVSGGVYVTGWTQHNDNIYCAPLNRETKLRQLYVNGRRARMAQGEEFFVDASIRGYGSYSIDKTESYALNGGERFLGYTFAKKYLRKYNNPSDVELVCQTGFGYHVIGLSDIISSGTRNVAVLQQPIGAIAQSIPEWGSSFISSSTNPFSRSKLKFQNAFELLDAAGEFYFDRQAQMLYYCPFEDEDMSTVEVIAPASEGLICVEGQSTNSRVCNLVFSGISFAYDHWPMMKVGDSYGDTAAQSVAMYTKYLNNGDMHSVKYANTQLQGAAIQVSNAESIHILNCKIMHTGAIGVSLGNDTVNSSIMGCVFRDTGSASINVGDPRNVLVGDGDFDEDVEGVPQNITISNNYIKSAAVESKQAPMISVFFSDHLQISHNDLSEAPYTGISLGWGWVNFVGKSFTARENSVSQNKIHDVIKTMHDGAAIYTLGEQPGSTISGNHIYDVGKAYPCIYLDQGSAYFTVTDNACTTNNLWFFVWGKAAQVKGIIASGNYTQALRGDEFNELNNSPDFTNATGEYSSRIGEITEQAGLEPTYRHLLDE